MTDRPFLSAFRAWRRSRERQSAAGARRLPLKGRADAVFLGLAVLLVGILGAGAYGTIEVARVVGWLDPPVAASVRDERLLDNLRRDLPERKLLAAAWDSGEKVLTVSQSGGVVHRLDAGTGLWSREQPADDAPALRSDLIQMRVGCGSDPAARQDCADPTPLWGLGEHGALVRRLDGRWRSLIGDSAFIGRDGKPVEGDALSAAALSKDGKWLFLGTKMQGGGLYTLKDRNWVALGPAQDALPPGRIDHAVWWHNRFVIAGPEGLAFLVPDESAPAAERSATVAAVADLLVDDRGRLLVLEKRPCDVGGDGCLRVSALKRPGGSPELLMNERNRYPELDAGALFFADLQGKALVVLGQKGVFAYDPDMRNWTRLDDRPVRTAVRENGAMLYGYNGGAAAIARGVVESRWDLPGKQVAQILWLDRSPVALTEDGDVYSLPSSGSPEALFLRGGTATDPRRFTEAFAAGERVLLTGSGKALLHDVRQRSYADVDPGSLPSWLTDSRTRKVVSGTHLYGLVAQGNGVTGSALDLAVIGGSGGPAGIDVLGTTPLVPGPVRQARPWANNGLAAIDANGSLHRLGIGADEALTGVAQPSLDRVRLRDIADVGVETVIATGSGIRTYDHSKRQWGDWAATKLDGGDIRSIATDGRRLLLHTGNDRLGLPDGSVLIGQDRVSLKAGSLSDALRNANLLYLAGQGSVEQYDLAARSVTRRWNPPGNAAIGIIDFLNGEPLTLSEGRVALGDTLLGGSDGRVLSISTDPARILTVREQNGARYLRTHDSSAPRNPLLDQCLFRTSTAGGRARQLLDARPLGSGWMLVLTDDGLRLYSETARSWYSVRGLSKPVASLHRVGSHMALVAGQNPVYVQFIALSEISRPGSCATEPVPLPDRWTEVQSISIDEAAGTAAWLAGDGSVQVWNGGKVQPVLASTGAAPQIDKALRVFTVGDGADAKLAFGMPDGLALYRLSNHSWSHVELKAAEISLRGLADVNLEPGGIGQAVTARLEDGRTFVGQWGGGTESVWMSEVRSPLAPPFVQQGSAIIDVVQDGNYWTFLLDDRLKRFDTSKRRFAPDIQFPSADRSRKLVRRAGRLVVEQAGGPIWWVARGTLPIDGPGVVPAETVFDRIVPVLGESTLVADDGRIVRLRMDGAVQACKAADVCEEVVPAAPRLDPTTVISAHEVGRLLLIETKLGRRLYDRDQRRERPLPPELASLGPMAETLLESGILWMRDGNGAVVTLTAEGIARKQAPGVSALVLDRNRRIWLKGPSLMVDAKGLQPIEAAFGLGKGIGALAPTLVPNGIPALLGSDLRPRLLNAQGVETGAPLAPDVDSGAVTTVFPTSRIDTWWVQTAQSLTRLVAKSCPPPQAAPFDAQGPNAKSSGDPQSAVSALPPPAECLAVDLTLPLPDTGLVVAVDDGLPSRLTIRLSDGGTLESRLSDKGLESPTAQRNPTGKDTRPRGIDGSNAWPRWSSRVVPRPDGAFALDPVQEFEFDGDRMRLKTPGDGVQLVPAMRRQPEAIAALDQGWLKWDRQASRFIIRGPNGPNTLAPDEFVRDGRFIFADPGITVAAPGGELRIANRFGVWSYPNPMADLAGSNIVFTPQDLPRPVAAAHGRFLFEAGGVPYAGGAVTADDDRHTWTVGDAVWTERLRRPSVAVEMRVAGKTLNAGGSGFAWDRRRAVALADDAVQVQTNAGILRADRLSDADPGPSGQLPVAGTIMGRDGGDLFLVDGGHWQRRTAGRWQQSTVDTMVSRDLPPGRGLRWRLTPHGAVVDGVTLAAGVPSVGFADDQLRAAATDGGRLIVVDALGLAVGTLDTISGRAARRLALDTDVGSLQVMRPKPAMRMIVARGRDGVRRWDPAGERFIPIADADNPFMNRELVDHRRLRMAVHDSRVSVELLLDAPSGGSSWVPITMEDGFPFDRVLGIHILGGRLFVGTAAGLEEHSDTDRPGFDTILRLIDLRAGGVTAPAPVQRMGEPVGKPGVLAVRAPGRCITFDGHAYADCERQDLADTTRRAMTRWWQWQRDTVGTVTGEYRDGAGQTLGLPVVMQGGRFGHDRIADMAMCGGRAALLWESGPVTVHDGASTDLNGALRTAVLPGRDGRLFCLERTIREPEVDAPAGLYWIAEQEVRRLDGMVWQAVTSDGARTAIRMRADYGMPLDRTRLRLVQDRRSPPRFQQRRVDGTWEDVGWKDNRIALDSIERLTVADGRLWAVTGAGIATLERGADRTLQFDPDGLTILREPARNCRITDLETGGDGETWLRCNGDSRNVQHGRLNPKVDQSVFKPSGPDPFAERELVSTASGGVWGWRLTGHVGGRPGQLSGTFRNEPAKLDGGRFGFDSVAQIRSFVPGTLELLTEGAGWFRATGGGIGLGSTARPSNDRIDRQAVRRIAVARDAEGHPRLCVSSSRSQAVLLDPELVVAEQAAVCRDDLGGDGLWRYEQDSDGLRIHALDRRQRSGLRSMKEGRFTDEIALGLPVPQRMSDGTVEHLVPTAAGVVAFGPDAWPKGVYLPVFPDLPRSGTPSVLLQDSDGRVSYLGIGNLVRLQEETMRPIPLQQLLSAGAKPLALEPSFGGLLRLGWEKGGAAGWTLFDPRALKGSLVMSEPIDTFAWREYTELRAHAGNAEPNLQVSLSDSVLRVTSGFGNAVPLSLPAIGTRRALIRADQEIFIVGTTDVWVINLPSALRGTFAGNAPGGGSIR